MHTAGSYERSLLLIMEADLISRFEYVEQVLCRDKHVLPLTNVSRRNPLSTLVARLRMRHEVFAAYDQLKSQLSNYRYVFLSNTEGFIARNVAKWIRRDFPDVILLDLQHGIFMRANDRTRALITCLNKLTELALDYSLAGSGIFQKEVNFYIVYNNWYKSLLVRLGVPADRVIVSSFLLKGKKLFEMKKVASTDNRTALFLLQCLSELAITDKKTEVSLNQFIVKWLSENYDVVLLKQHPYCNIEIAGLPVNCKFVEGDVTDIAQECGTVVSFFSSALFECELLGLRTIAISDDRLKVIPGIYKLFKEVGEVQEDGSLSLKTNPDLFSTYFESEIHTAEELFAVLDGNIGSPGNVPGERREHGPGVST